MRYVHAAKWACHCLEQVNGSLLTALAKKLAVMIMILGMPEPRQARPRDLFSSPLVFPSAPPSFPTPAASPCAPAAPAQQHPTSFFFTQTPAEPQPPAFETKAKAPLRAAETSANQGAAAMCAAADPTRRRHEVAAAQANFGQTSG